tara:strand:- start:133 stop:2052 length:1920 start_codon:yes stop_codon:yes gene_type:complete
MTWYRELLSENKQNKSVSTLGDLLKLIEEVYEHKKDTLFVPKKTETQLLRERFESPEGATLTLQAIPEIAVSELGWTNITGEGVEEVSGPERKKLEQFLSNIQGNNFQSKIQSLAKFYDDPDAALQAMFPADKATSTARQIAAALGYLTFFKTLTKVISNFNAASAGFNFEAFLAVLSGGYQVKANTGTIADFVSRADGKNTPISLKLYQEGKLHVGGSFTDLANDLYEQKEEFDYPFMRYLAVTKQFEGGQKEGLDINGQLRWFQFDFTLENVFDILSQSSTKSQKCIMLPTKFISGETPDYAATLPGSAIPSPEKLENVFVEAFKLELSGYNEELASEGKEIMQVGEDLVGIIMADLNWSSEDAYFNPWTPDKEYFAKLKAKGEEIPDDFEPTPAYVSRGDSSMQHGKPGKTALIASINSSLERAQTNGHASLQGMNSNDVLRHAKRIASCAVMANNGTGSKSKTKATKTSVLATYSKSKLKDARLQKINAEGEFASIEASRDWYNAEGRTDDERRTALKQSYGYLTTEQFNLNQAVVERVHTLTNKRTLPEGQSQTEFGVIYVGANNTQNMLNRMTGLINEAIFGLFLSVKTVQENTYSFMAGGLQDTGKADDAIAASNEIIEKTTDLKQASPEEK